MVNYKSSPLSTQFHDWLRDFICRLLPQEAFNPNIVAHSHHSTYINEKNPKIPWQGFKGQFEKKTKKIKFVGILSQKTGLLHRSVVRIPSD
jgi:hypothetical protein